MYNLLGSQFRLNYRAFCLLFIACQSEESAVQPSASFTFSVPVKVEITGYTGHIMEPFLTRDGHSLFFNNLNDPIENTNLHWAKKVNDTIFQYQGEISGVNTPALEGVPTMSTSGHFYFVSTRNYSTTLSTLFHGQYNHGELTHVQPLSELSVLKAGWVNFDIEVNADDDYIYFVDGQIDQNGVPSSADVVIAKNTTTGFQRLPNSSEILKSINTNDLEYAVGISVDHLELYFTRLSLPITQHSLPEIFYSTRKSSEEPFSIPVKISILTGFVEAPTMSSDQKSIYFHRKEGGKHYLYLIRKK